MKYLHLTLLAFGAFCGSLSAQTTYTWSGASGGNWNDAANWTPNGVPTTLDEAVFNTPGALTVVPNTTNIAKLTITNGALVKLSSSSTFTLTIAGGTGTDLNIATGTELDISSTAAVACTLSVSTGATGSINGDLKFNSTAGASHKCVVADANGLAVYGRVIQGLNVNSNLFTNTGTQGVVAFKAGSSFMQFAGANPFALTAPASKVIFETGSWFRFRQNSAPSLAGRPFANLEINFPTFNQTTTSGANPFNVDTILVTSMASWTTNFPLINIKALTVNAGMMTLSGPTAGAPAIYNITGDISANGSAIINLAPPASGVTPGSVRLVGTTKQSINRAMTAAVNVGPGTLLEFANPAGFDMNTSLMVPTALKMTSGIVDMKTNTLTLGSGLGVQTGTLLYNGAQPCYFINGYFKRWFDGTQDVMDAMNQTVQKCGFPLGSATEKFIALGFTIAPTMGGTVTARFYDLPVGNSGIPYADGNFLVNYMDANGYWELTSGDGMDLTAGTYNMLMLGKGFNPIEGLEKMTETFRVNSSSPWMANGIPVAAIDAGMINPNFAGHVLIARDGLTNFGQYSIGHALTAYSFGSTGMEKVLDVATDVYGNRYVAGTFSGTIDFDPGVNNNSLTTATPAGFVARYNNLGALSWVKMLGTNANSVAIINNPASPNFGSVLVIGDFTGNGGVALNGMMSAGSIDCFVAQIDTFGNTTLAFKIGDKSQESGTSIAIDQNENIYITGFFNLTVDFDPSLGVTQLTAAGVSDAFVAAYSSSGSYLWANKIGANLHDKGYGVAVGDGVYAVGSFQGSTLGMTSVASYDAYVVKYDLNGSVLWAKNFGGSNIDWATDIALDASNNAYVCGLFRTTVDFDPNAGIFNLTSAYTNTDAFVTSLDMNGSFRWAKAIGGGGMDQANGISVATDVLVTGYFRSLANITGGGQILGTNDNIFVTRFDLNGALQCARSIGGTGFEQGNSIAHEGNSNYFLGGSYSTSMVAEYNDAIQFNFSSMGSNDAFVMRGTTCVAGVFKNDVTESEPMEETINNSNAFQTTIYPNPNQGTFTLAVNQIQHAKVQVMDMTGKVVFSKQMTENELNIELNVPAGLYLVSTSTDTEQHVQKIIIQ